MFDALRFKVIDKLLGTRAIKRIINKLNFNQK